MGTWATTPFGNDAASDWAYGLSECDDLSLIEDTLDNVLELRDEYLEAPDAEEAIAAIEVLAKLKGSSGDPNEEVDVWVEKVKKVKLSPSKALAEKAFLVIDRVLASNSELFELWGESDEFDAWKNSVEALKARISAQP